MIVNIFLLVFVFAPACGENGDDAMCSDHIDSAPLLQVRTLSAESSEKSFPRAGKGASTPRHSAQAGKGALAKPTSKPAHTRNGARTGKGAPTKQPPGQLARTGKGTKRTGKGTTTTTTKSIGDDDGESDGDGDGDGDSDGDGDGDGDSGGDGDGDGDSDGDGDGDADGDGDGDDVNGDGDGEAADDSDSDAESEAQRQLQKEHRADLRRHGCTPVGFHWGVEELVRRNGLFRGVALATGISNEDLDAVVQFNTAARAKSEEQLRMAIEINPDIKTTEGSVSSTDSSSVEKANSLIESFGSSAFSSSSTSAGLGASSPSGLVSFGLNFGSGDSDSSASKRDQAHQAHMSKKTSTYAMTTYYMEPRSLLKIDASLLEATPTFMAFAAEVAKGARTEEDLFHRFGTHICTKVLLGGWWRITAHAQSSATLSAMDLHKAASSSIKSKSSSSQSASVGIPIFSASVSHNSAKGSSRDSSSSSSSSHSSADSRMSVDTYEEWKGGESGCSSIGWRKSLDVSMNSNWKIIDRHVDECRGVWNFVHDPSVKMKLCTTWREMFIKEIGLRGGDAEALVQGNCNSSASMQEFREELVKLKKKQEKEFVERMQAVCDAVPGYHFDATVRSCNADLAPDTKKTNYADLGSGKCRVKGKGKGKGKGHLIDPKYAYHPRSSNCEALCTADPKCYGFSLADDNNCLLWNQRGLLGGGPQWGGSHCIIKKIYTDFGLGRCLVGGKAPHSESHIGASNCEDLCTAKSNCYGYSLLQSNETIDCRLWLQSGLMGGGPAWGSAHCHVKIEAVDCRCKRVD